MRYNVSLIRSLAMKKIAIPMAILALTALAGCASKPATTSTNQTSSPTVNTPSVATVKNFTCQNGIDVSVRHLGNNQIELTTSPDVKRAVLTQAVSGSGERYVTNSGLWGNGGEWHQKGNTAYFEYVGVHGGSPKHTNCTAQ